MRLKAELRVNAHLRRCTLENIPAVLSRRGHASAGSIFVLVDLCDGRGMLYGPPPGPVSDEDGVTRWQSLNGPEPGDMAQLRDMLKRQAAFDPDIWIIEMDERTGRHLLDGPVIDADQL